jgi:hypothetical protein
MGAFLYLITILIEHSPIFTMAVVPAERSVVRVAVLSVAVTVASSVPEVLYIARSVPSASPLRVITPPWVLMSTGFEGMPNMPAAWLLAMKSQGKR